MSKKADVQLNNIIKEFQTPEGKGSFRAVDDVSLHINSGEFVTLLGPSGCGKTTILRMIAGFEAPTSGEVLLDNELVNNMTPDKRDTAMVFQSYALFPHYNVFDNVAYGLINKKLDKQQIHENVLNILSLVGLSGLEKRNTNQLSGGQQQRVALARALVMEPAVLLFDEPLSNLDAKLRIYMRKEIRKIQQRIGLTSIYVTHDQAEAMSLSDRIIIMNKGKIEQMGTPHEIYQQPASKFVADFIGNANFVSGEVLAVAGEIAQVRMLGRVLPVHVNPAVISAGDSVYVVVRPEAVEISSQSGDVAAQVLASTYMGAVQEYTVQVLDVELNIEDFNPVGKETFAAGDNVNLKFRSGTLHAIKQ